MTIEAVNSLDREDFVAALGWVFEHSPWVAERTWDGRPFATVDALHQAMVTQVEAASTEQQRGLLRAHPDLGTRARLSDASAAEQGGAGLDQLTPQEFDELQRLNNDYRVKFGFPFLFAVKGSTKHDILRALRERLDVPQEEEYAEALRQVYRIARFRIEDSVIN
jgi:2-oxo-4-hydroxy-4-carboxy-5-ureidoimidazoline decarboxylase